MAAFQQADPPHNRAFAGVRRACLTTVAVFATVSACNQMPSNLPVAPVVPTSGALEIEGPQTVALGSSAQFTARVRMSDGTTKLAADVRWFATSPFALRVTSTGVVTGTGIGEGTVTAEATGVPGGTRRATRELIVLPSGTFRLAGTVIDGEFAGTPVAGARLRAGPEPWQTVTSDLNGHYKIFGVPPDATMQITRDGYLPLTEAFQVSGHASRNFVLLPSAPRLTLGGHYLLTVDFIGTCSQLVNDLQHRRYETTIAQAGITLSVSLTEPRFRLNGSGSGNRFTGVAGPGGATFQLETYDYYFGTRIYPSVAERLPDGSFLVVEGSAATTGTSGGLSGVLNGQITRWQQGFPETGPFLGGCFGPMQFSLTPR